MFVGVEGEYRVKNVMVGGEPLDLEKIYTLASHNYMLQGQGDGYTIFEDNVYTQESVMLDNPSADHLHHRRPERREQARIMPTPMNSGPYRSRRVSRQGQGSCTPDCAGEKRGEGFFAGKASRGLGKLQRFQPKEGLSPTWGQSFYMKKRPRAGAVGLSKKLACSDLFRQNCRYCLRRNSPPTGCCAWQGRHLPTAGQPVDTNTVRGAVAPPDNSPKGFFDSLTPRAAWS